MGNLIHKFLPRQTDIDKILHIIQRKVLKGTHLLVEIKEIQAGYLHSPYFKEIYQSWLSMDLKVMPKSQKGHKYVLFVIDEVTNFLIMVPIFKARSEEVGEALLEHVITRHCILIYIIMDQESRFMSSLMTYIFHRLNIKIKTIALYNHQSLQAEHGIKPLTCILTKHLTGRCRQNIYH